MQQCFKKFGIRTVDISGPKERQCPKEVVNGFAAIVGTFLLVPPVELKSILERPAKNVEWTDQVALSGTVVNVTKRALFVQERPFQARGARSHLSLGVGHRREPPGTGW